MSRTVCLIVNPVAGGGRAARVLPSVERALDGHGVTARTEMTRDLEHARHLASDAVAAGETVVTLSGDGLVGTVADELRAHPGAVMGILPGGRGNDLARLLGIPVDPVAACAVVADGVEREIDLGEVNGRAFISIASAGFDSEVNRIANEAPAWLGRAVYSYGILRALGDWRPTTMRLDADPPAPRREYTVYSVAAANSSTYGGGMRLAPEARLDDGLLDVVIIEAMPRWRLLVRAWHVFNGTHGRFAEVQMFKARTVSITADRPFTAYADGDPIAELPVEIRALPAALRVLVPATAAA